jgi:hypothetical protein
MSRASGPHPRLRKRSRAGLNAACLRSGLELVCYFDARLMGFAGAFVSAGGQGRFTS